MSWRWLLRSVSHILCFGVGYFWGLTDQAKQVHHLLSTHRLALSECNAAVSELQKFGARFAQIQPHGEGQERCQTGER